MNPKAKLAAALLAMFVIGGITGAALNEFGHSFFHPHPGDMHNRLLNLWRDRLHLTPDQEKQIGPIADDFAQKVEALHDQSAKQFTQLADATDDAIAPYLTPEQKTELQNMRKDRQNGPHGFGPGGPGHPDDHPPGPPGDHPPGPPPP
jgi:Spy/CpxP family protein refolding chaperone